MRTVWIIGGSERTSRVLAEQVASYVQEKAQVVGTSVDAVLPTWKPEDLVVVSSTLIVGNLTDMGITVPEDQLIIGRRTVNPDKLESVVALAPGTNVVFINDTRETAEECVHSLMDLGINYVNWYTWYPGLDVFPQNCMIAVVAGEPQLVPNYIAEIIDIHVRIFDFGTIAEILERLAIPYVDITTFSQRYLAKIVSLARNLARKSEEAQRLYMHLSSVIDSLTHGILVYNEDGRVTVCNEEVRSLLALRPTQGVGDTLPQLVRSRELLEFLECRCGEEERTFKLAAGPVVVHRFDLQEDAHAVAVFKSEAGEADQFKLGKEYRKRGHVAKYTFDDIVGESEEILTAKRIASKLAETDLSILIQGETGTGKELFASAIHSASSRARGPFLAVDLGSLSDELIESELFGYEEGAFTGARKGGKPGLFELAHGGTLFLDEIGNISGKVQTRLLRVLQEKELMHVGGSDIMRVDVRVIAATNENLLEKAREGLFREDLIFRLRMGWLRIPPLRERVEDIPALVKYFMRQEGAVGLSVSPDVLDFFSRHDWPGNVRELKNLLTYMIAVREGPVIRTEDIPTFVYSEKLARGGTGSGRNYGWKIDALPGKPRGMPLDIAPDTAGTGGSSDAGVSGKTMNRTSVFRNSGKHTPGHSFPLMAGYDGERNGEGDGVGYRFFHTPATLEEEDTKVLEAIAYLETAGQSTGRDSVSGFLYTRGIYLGPGSVRASFARLALKKLVTAPRGRRGTQLTRNGWVVVQERSPELARRLGHGG